jgi:hypothetical protein
MEKLDLFMCQTDPQGETHLPSTCSRQASSTHTQGCMRVLSTIERRWAGYILLCGCNIQLPKHHIFSHPINQPRTTKNIICSLSRPPDHLRKYPCSSKHITHVLITQNSKSALVITSSTYSSISTMKNNHR